MSPKPKKTPASAAPRVATDSFLTYLRGQKKLIMISTALSTLLFIVFKICFPVPDFFLDSFNYVQDCVLKLDISYRPLGYSNFLTFLHFFSTSANLPVVLHFIIFLISSLFCFLSCDYLFGFPPRLRILVLLLTLFNPILIIQANLISSDSLFCSLTVIWFTLCLWLIKRNHWGLLLAHIVFMYLCFDVRYTALFYPVVAVIIIAISKGSPVYKIAGIAVTLLVIFYSVEQQKDLYEKRLRVRVFSGFSGWQLANNVLCYYKEIKVDCEELPWGDPVEIDSLVHLYIDSMYKENYIGTQYLWESRSPFKYYLARRIAKSKATYFYEWNGASKPLAEYAWSVIRQQPMAYVKFFMLRNFFNCFLFPDAEVLKNYDFFKNEIPNTTKQWFVKLDHLSCRYPGLQRRIISVYPTVSFVVNIVNMVVLLIMLVFAFLWRRRLQKDTLRLFAAWFIFYSGYVVFAIFSTVVLLRYLDPLFVLGFIMPAIAVQQLIKEKGRVKEEAVKPS